MYKITIPDGTVLNREYLDFIRVHKNGCYVITTRNKAEGVCINGTPYLYKDGTILQEIDRGEYIDKLISKNKELESHLAETDEVAIELYEASLAQEAINAEQDEAIIEIYEAMEVMSNG